MVTLFLLANKNEERIGNGILLTPVKNVCSNWGKIA